MLLRSLLICTVSSNRLLLFPAIAILSYISNPDRSFLLNAERNPILRAFLKRTFYNQFCAGENAQETRACVKLLKDFGFGGVILTYAREVPDVKVSVYRANSDKEASMVGEIAEIDAGIDAWKNGCLDTADMVGDNNFLAIKITGAGPAVRPALAADTLPPQQMVDALNEICLACKERNIRIIVDAEGQYFQKGIDRITLELMRKFNRDGTAVIYNTYQAYLKSTKANIAYHMSEARKDGFTLGLKVVRGAYILTEERSLIHDSKEETDAAYDAIAQGALKREFEQLRGESFPSVNLLLASHNKASVMAGLQLYQERVRQSLPTVPVIFAQLHGMSDALSFSLLLQKAAGHEIPTVLKCSTWGNLGECLGFLVRRAVENRDSVLRTSDEFTAVRAECWRRFKGIFSSVRHAEGRNKV